MRQKQQIQLKLSAPWPDYPFPKELATMIVVKAAVLHKVLGMSYERLVFNLADSTSCRCFLCLGPFDAAPSASALQNNISRLKV